MPSWRPRSSARTPLTVPPRNTANGWHRYEVITRSSGVIADSIPTDTASCCDASKAPRHKRSAFRLHEASSESEGTDLAGSQVTETTDKLLPVEGVRGHLHPAHEGHFLVHVDQHLLVDLDVKRRDFGLVSLESVFMKPDGERLGGSWSLCWLSAVRCRLERAS